MANLVEENASKILIAIFEEDKNQSDKGNWFKGDDLLKLTNIKQNDINDAIEFLDDRGLIERLNYIGTFPYRFGQIRLNSKGRYVYHEIMSFSQQQTTTQTTSVTPSNAIFGVTPLPVGSPFGFTDLDWEYVQKKRKQRTILFVIMGFQIESSHYDASKLKSNIKAEFEKAIDIYNSRGGRDKILLEFKPLAAGYGEHLFNQIARDIIASDIAIFETSDLNPNVMIEMGVALTWGCRVLPIKKLDTQKPPSDISGQTWADYTENGTGFISDNHQEEIVAMVERAIQKKSVS